LGQWQRERPDLDPSPIGVIGRISRLSREIERRIDPVHTASGLEPGWYDVLATLRRAGPPYQLRPTDFAATLMLTSSGTTKRLDRLEAASDHLDNERHILAGLSPTEQRQLAALLRKLTLTLPPPARTR